MKQRRVLAMLLTAATAASLLTGCGGGKTGSETTTAASGESAGTGNSEDASSGEQVNLRFVSWLTAYQDLDKKVAEAYMKEHPNVIVL